MAYFVCFGPPISILSNHVPSLQFFNGHLSYFVTNKVRDRLDYPDLIIPRRMLIWMDSDWLTPQGWG